MSPIALLFALTLSPNAPAADPDYGSFTSNGYRLSSIEYWGNGGYDGGNGVCFGYTCNEKEANRACGRKAWNELKKTLDSNPPELKALKEAGGPQTIYIIISDMSNNQDGELDQGSVWHYRGDHGRGGMMKFHAMARKKANGTLECNYPKKADVIAFAKEKKEEIDRNREPVATQAAPEPASAPVSIDSQIPAPPAYEPPNFNVNGSLD